MDEDDIVIRLHRAWANPSRLPDDELRTLFNQAITEIEVLRLMQDECKVHAVYEAVARARPREE